MSQTLRRELYQKLENVLFNYIPEVPLREAIANQLTDAALEVSGIAKRAALPLDWKIAGGLPVTEADLLTEQLKHDATAAFEREMGFGSLPWWSDKTWDGFGKFVVAVFKKDHSAFSKYARWRADDGKFNAMSNKQIRQNPAAYMDTGWPEFENATRNPDAGERRIPTLVRE